MAEASQSNGGQRRDSVGQVQLANQLIDTVSDEGVWELRLAWRAALDHSTHLDRKIESWSPANGA